MAKMPKQKPHRSKQNYRTPPEFFDAVALRFGAMEVDLAASDVRLCLDWLGPGGMFEDSLASDWCSVLRGRIGWLNPPFERIGKWAEKCAVEGARGARVVMLTPASWGEWYSKHVQGNALTLAIRPRIKFVGEVHLYPKDLAIHLFGFGLVGFATWRWKQRARARTKNARGLKPGKGRK